MVINMTEHHLDINTNIYIYIYIYSICRADALKPDLWTYWFTINALFITHDGWTRRWVNYLFSRDQFSICMTAITLLHCEVNPISYMVFCHAYIDIAMFRYKWC